jgi:uncharacterized protein (TIGR02246 family)
MALRASLIAAVCAAAFAGPSAGADLTRAALEQWLQRYEQAWETRDAARAAEIFTTDATYRETPFAEPFKGRAGIRDYWAGVTADQRDVDFRYDVIAVSGNVGVAHWSASLTQASSDAKVTLDGVFVLEFDAAGQLCRSLREWWHLPE